MRDLMRIAPLALLVIACGCKSDAQGPSINVGKAVCESCGMTVQDARFAAVVKDGSTVHTYDSIECLLKHRRTAGDASAAGIWIMDFDTQTLQPASSVTIVKGDFPSPMGGGYAAFADAAQARAQAEAHQGRVGTLDQALSGELQGGRP